MKGQLITLDLLLALVIITFSFGLGIQAIERQQNTLIDNFQFQETKNITLRAVDLIGGNPELNCKLLNGPGNPLFELPNTVKENSNPTKSQLGIPANYGCKITNLTTECNDTLTTENSYAVTTKIIECPENGIETSQLKSGETDNWEKNLTIMVWKL